MKTCKQCNASLGEVHGLKKFCVSCAKVRKAKADKVSKNKRSRAQVDKANARSRELYQQNKEERAKYAREYYKNVRKKNPEDCARRTFYGMRSRCNKHESYKNVELNFTIEEFIPFYLSLTHCKNCNIELNQFDGSTDNGLQLHRIRDKGNYSKENIQPVCKKCHNAITHLEHSIRYFGIEFIKEYLNV